MEQIVNELWYVFGVGAILFILMGLIIRYLINEKSDTHEEAKKKDADNLEAVKDVTRAITSLEILIKTKF